MVWYSGWLWLFRRHVDLLMAPEATFGFQFELYNDLQHFGLIVYVSIFWKSQAIKLFIYNTRVANSSVWLPAMKVQPATFYYIRYISLLLILDQV